jgi:hypothetical protein
VKIERIRLRRHIQEYSELLLGMDRDISEEELAGLKREGETYDELLDRLRTEKKPVERFRCR